MPAQSADQTSPRKKLKMPAQSADQTQPLTKLPVTLLSGFLGSGKTTLLKHILQSKDHRLRCAVIVNDMAEINIDGAAIENSQLIQTEEKLVQMKNGCICCTLRSDLAENLSQLAAEGSFDYVIIESTGVSEPMQVAETFTTEFSQMMVEQQDHDADAEDLEEELKIFQSLSESARLDTCVSMVDASSFYQYFNSSKFLAEAFDDADDEDEKTVVDLLVDQVEFADVIVLNKMDTVTSEKANKIEGILKSLNSTAKIIRSEYSKIDLQEILNTGLFNMAKATTSPGWLKSLNEEVVPETIEYGISSFVYRQRRPFHPEKIYQLMKKAFLVIENAGVPDFENDDSHGNEDEECNDGDDDEEPENEAMSEEEEEIKSSGNVLRFPEESETCFESKCESVFKHVIRSKGFAWIAGKDAFMADWSQAGIILTMTNAGSWFVDLPEEMEEMKESNVDAYEAIMKEFHEDTYIGDRRQEIVFIGDFDNEEEKEQLKLALDSCLINKNDKIDEDENPWDQWF